MTAQTQHIERTHKRQKGLVSSWDSHPDGLAWKLPRLACETTESLLGGPLSSISNTKTHRSKLGDDVADPILRESKGNEEATDKREGAARSEEFHSGDVARPTTSDTHLACHVVAGLKHHVLVRAVDL